MLINKEKTAESGCGGRSREDTKKKTERRAKNEENVAIIVGSLDRFSVTAF